MPTITLKKVAPRVRFGSWPCENARVLRRRRMAFSSVRCSFLLARGLAYVELCTPATPSLFDDPPSLRTEGHFIKKVFVVVATSLLPSRRGLRHRVLSMRLLFVPQGSGGHLIC